MRRVHPALSRQCTADVQPRAPTTSTSAPVVPLHGSIVVRASTTSDLVLLSLSYARENSTGQDGFEGCRLLLADTESSLDCESAAPPLQNSPPWMKSLSRRGSGSGGSLRYGTCPMATGGLWLLGGPTTDPPRFKKRAEPRAARGRETGHVEISHLASPRAVVRYLVEAIWRLCEAAPLNKVETKREAFVPDLISRGRRQAEREFVLLTIIAEVTFLP